MIDIPTMSQAYHLVNQLFYLFVPVIFPAIVIAQGHRFLKSTIPVRQPDILDGGGPYCVVL